MELANNELRLRHDKIRAWMKMSDIDAALIACNVDILYTCGEVVNGYVYLPLEGDVLVFIKRPASVTGEHIFQIRKPEQITEILVEKGIPLPRTLMLEADELSYNDYIRLERIFAPAKCVNGTVLLRKARTVKTPFEIELFRKSAVRHVAAYQKIPGVYSPGMTDVEFSIEIERLMRQEGCLGVFRVFGQSMEIFMGSLLAGENAAVASPYDFALGGEGLDPSIPGGANGAKLKEGTAVMVDYGGNFYGYMHDMTRVFSIGKLPEEAYRAHEVCLEIQERVIEAAKPGTPCENLYNIAIETVNKLGFAPNFMGTVQKAKFIGHGIGLEINEAPVLAPRVKQELEPGMIFALEPKIVLPGVGAVGIENSWVVTESGAERLNNFSDSIVELG